MKTIRQIGCGFAACLWVAALSAQSASDSQVPPPAGGGDTVQLPSFQVNETADRGYLAGNSVSATRISTPIANLPFSVSAFTPQFIADIGAENLYDVVKYSAGVESGEGNAFLGGNTDFQIRGFIQYPEHDGLYEGAHGNIFVDDFDVERVEVVKGPASLLYGAISPGGTVNYITKAAQPTPFVTVNGQWGSYDFGRATIDINQPLAGNTLLFRFNAAIENGYQFVYGTNSKTLALAPTVTWNITPKLSIRANYQYFHRDQNPPDDPIAQMEVTSPANVVSALYSPGNPGPSAALTGKTGIDIAEGFGSDSSNPGFLEYYPRFPNTTGNYGATNDEDIFALESGNIEVDATLSNHWKSRFNFNYNHSFESEVMTGQSQFYLAVPNSLTYSGGAWSVSPSWTALSTAQQTAAELAFAQTTMANANNALQTQNGVQAPVIEPRRPLYEEFTDNNTIYQWETAGEYDFSWGNLKPLAGVFYDTNRAQEWEADNLGTAASPYFQNWDVDPASPTYYVNKNTSWTIHRLTNVVNSSLAWSSDQAAYGIIDASFLNDTLYVVGGARYNASQSQTTNYIAAAGTNPVGEGYKAHYTTPQGGLGYKITKDLLLYASYSQSYALPSTTYLNTIETVNGVLQSVPTKQAVPTIGKGYEVGLKTNFLNGRVSSTLSVYDIDEFNVVESINTFIGGTSYATSVQNTEIASKGVEFETTYSPLDNWQIFLSAAEDDARNVEEPPGYAYYLGEPPAYFSKTVINLWTRYNFTEPLLKGLWIGGGFNFASKEQQDAVNPAAFLPGYTLYNAALGYDFTWGKHRLSVKLNGNNLKNTFYVPTTQARGLPRSVLLSVTGAF